MKIYNKVVIDIKTNKILEEDSFSYFGELSLCGGSGGGGGSSGAVEYPAYIESAFQAMWGFNGATDVSDDITVDLVDVLNATMTNGGGNPYNGESAVDPDATFTPTATSPLGMMQSHVDDFETAVDNISNSTDWDSTYDATVTDVNGKYTKTDIHTQFGTADGEIRDEIDDVVSDASTAASAVAAAAPIDDVVDSYEDSIEGAHLRSVARLAAMMSNNINSSAFAFTLAHQEFDHTKKVSEFSGKLKLDAFNNAFSKYVDSYNANKGIYFNSFTSVNNSNEDLRGRLAIESAKLDESITLQRELQQAELLGKLAQLQADVSRVTLLALREQYDKDLEIDVGDAKWDLTTLVTGSNILASISGAAAAPSMPTPSTTQSAIGGAFSGAALGTAIAPGIGTGIGAIIGGIAGWLGA